MRPSLWKFKTRQPTSLYTLVRFVWFKFPQLITHGAARIIMTLIGVGRGAAEMCASGPNVFVLLESVEVLKMHLVADYSVFSLLTLEPDTDDCKLYNYYDAQSCSVASIGILLGSLICFFGEWHSIRQGTFWNKCYGQQYETKWKLTHWSVLSGGLCPRVPVHKGSKH